MADKGKDSVYGYYCAYRPCKSRSGQDISHFAFPKDEARSNIWARACNREDLIQKGCATLHKYHKLCEKHFEAKFISIGGQRRKTLFSQAIPTLFHYLPKRPATGDMDISEPTSKVFIAEDLGKETSSVSPQPSCIKYVPLETADVSRETFPTSPQLSSQPCCSKSLSVEIDLSREILSVSPPPSCSKSLLMETSDDNMETFPTSPQLSSQPSCSKSLSVELVHSDMSTQTPGSLTYGTPRKKKLRVQLKTCQRRLSQSFTPRNSNKNEWTLEDFNKMADSFLNKPLAELVKAQGNLRKRKPIARRYSMEYKKFALTLYFLGPRAYKFLSKLLYLPSKRSLQRITQKLMCNVGLQNKSIFKAIKIKVGTMVDQDRHCILCLDEMALKADLFYVTSRDEVVGFPDIGNGKKDTTSYAQNALVIMARGLYFSWKQPIAYFFVKSQFTADELRPVIEECVKLLSDSGLIVDGIATDMGSNFIQLAYSFGVTPDNPEFEVAGKNLFYFFDTCHLIKATRNNLINNIFCFDGKKTSWTFIEHFYQKDKQEFYRLAPKLTNAHIHPTNFEKMRVSLATQVLSRTVACGMNVFVKLGELPAEASSTIDVFEKFNNLFDILNSSDLKHPNKFKLVFEGTEHQLRYLDEMLDFLKKLKLCNKNGQDITLKCKFVNCWIITINSIKNLWQKLSVQDFKYLKTKRINTDCLENFFGSIRQQGGNCINPTPIQFGRAFRKLFCQNYLHSNSMNCKNDLDEILMNVKARDILNEDSSDEVIFKSALAVNDYDYREDRLLSLNAFHYVCGYLIKKALNIHNCEICSRFSKECEQVDTSLLLTHFKAYEKDSSIYGGLRVPNKEFVIYIHKLEKIFTSKFLEFFNGNEVSHKYFQEMKKINFEHPCLLFPRDYIIKLFIRLKIFYTLKYSNREMRSTKDKNKRKVRILSNI